MTSSVPSVILKSASVVKAAASASGGRPVIEYDADDAGADKGLKDINGETPLDVAKLSEAPAEVVALLE